MVPCSSSLRSLVSNCIVRDHILGICRPDSEDITYEISIVHLIILHKSLPYSGVILSVVMCNPVPSADLFASEGEIARLSLIRISHFIFFLGYGCCLIVKWDSPSSMRDRSICLCNRFCLF